MESAIVNVYWAKIPKEMRKCVLFPKERQNEVLSCTNEKTIRQKYYAWRLLEYALSQSFGYKINDLTFCKEKNGKWTSSNCYFSISHSYDVVVVGVSNRPIGVDVEKIVARKAAFLQKVLTERERTKFLSILRVEDCVDYLFECWTKKESVFKKTGDGRFRPFTIDVADQAVDTKKITVKKEEYALSTATENVAQIRYFLDVDLTENYF